MSVQSRRKGLVGENEMVHVLESMGYTARRTAALQAGENVHGDPDVEVTELPMVHIEVKRVERLNLEKAMKQAEQDAARRLALPVVCHRQNQCEWMITLRLENLHKLMEHVEDAKHNSLN